jgi:hypothetical protein
MVNQSALKSKRFSVDFVIMVQSNKLTDLTPFCLKFLAVSICPTASNWLTTITSLCRRNKTKGILA